MSGPRPLSPDAMFVEPTATAYEADTERFVEKYRREAVARRFGDRFRDCLPASTGEPRVLDAGCGPGADAAVFAAAGVDTVGLDLSPGLLCAAAADVSRAGFVRGDMRSLPFEAETFDGVWSAASLLHLSPADAADALAGFARVLRPGGALFCSVIAREPRGVDAAELEDGRRFTFWCEDDLHAALGAAGFRVAWDSDQRSWHAVVAELQ